MTAFAETPVQPAAPAVAALPRVATDLTADQVLERLGLASRRGRLPGYVCGHRTGALFRLAAFGHPVDADLLGWMRAGSERGVIDFSLRLPRRLSWVLGLTLVLAAWPGVYFMDQLMIQFLPSVRDALAGWMSVRDASWTTWAWYLPLTVLPTPWVWRSVVSRARKTTLDSAYEMINKVAAETGGRVVPGQATPR